MLGYGTGAAMVARDVDGYLKKTGSAVPLRVAIRPMFPDCESTENLTGKLRLLGKRWGGRPPTSTPMISCG
jgi:hypothetical protein